MSLAGDKSLSGSGSIKLDAYGGRVIVVNFLGLVVWPLPR